MDYKYIEQLLERYFAAETSLEEESILRTFFHQEEIPAHLYQWRALFIADDDEVLGDDFDARILEMTSEESQPVKAHEVKLLAVLCRLPGTTTGTILRTTPSSNRMLTR